MAERSNAEKNHKAAQDVSTLQKRGRRRLVGAIALVLLAVIVLPMVFDPEPRQNAPTVNIRIPNEEGSKFTPKVAPGVASKVAPMLPQAAAPVATPEPPKAEPKAEPKPEPKAEPKPVEKKAPPAPKPAEKAPAPPKAAEKPAPAPAPAPSSGEKYVAQVGAFASAEKVKEITDQLTTAKLAHYVETVATSKGPVTRIRLGPYDSKEAAEKARERAKALGLNAANPILK